MRMKPNFYKQYDSDWAGVSGNGATVAKNGCGPTSIANVVSVLVDSKVTPATVFRYMADHKYVSGKWGSTWNGITQTLKHFGVTKFKVTSSADAAKKAIKAGHWVIGVVTYSRWTKGGHFIVLYDLNSKDRCQISDSASSSDARQKNGPWTEYKAAERMQWIDIDPKDYPNAPGKAKKSTTFTLWVSDAYANVRKGRGVKYGVKGILKRGTKLTLYSYSNGWYRIKTGKFKGYYISETTLSKYEPYVKKFELLEEMNLRKGYSTKTDIIKQIPKGTKVKSSKKKGDWIYAPKYKGWICVQSGGKVYLKEVKEEKKVETKPKTNAEKLCDMMQKQIAEMNELGFKYKNGGNAKTWTGAKKKRNSNCATCVCYALQRLGLIPKGMIFWLNEGEIRSHTKKDQKAAIKAIKKIGKIDHPNKPPKKAGLKKGDICGYSPHTQVFEGWNDKGEPLWDSWGTSDPGKKMPRVKSSYTNKKIGIRIRLK